MAPAWIHNGLTRAEAEATISEAGLDDGRFLVRKKGGETGQYILDVVYKGKVTHHSIGKDSEGILTVNKKRFGEHAKLVPLIRALGKKQPGWPVALDKPVERKVESHQTQQKNKVAAVRTEAPVAINEEELPVDELWYYHGSIKKAVADKLLKGDNGTAKPGKFLVRKRGDGFNEFVIGVIYKGVPTHHLMTRPSPGEEFSVNKMATGKDSIPGVIEYFRQKREKLWPVPLTDAVVRDGVRLEVHGFNCPGTLRFYGMDVQQNELQCGVELDEAVGEHDGSVQGHRYFQCEANKGVLVDRQNMLPIGTISKTESIKIDKVDEVAGKSNEVLVTKTPSTSSAASSETNNRDVDGTQPWLHGKISSAEAADLLAAHLDETGTFLIRRRENIDEFVVSIVYKGKATHHLCLAPPDSESTINKKGTNTIGLVETIRKMRTKQPWWPVPLKSHVAPQIKETVAQKQVDTNGNTAEVSEAQGTSDSIIESENGTPDDNATSKEKGPSTVLDETAEHQLPLSPKGTTDSIVEERLHVSQESLVPTDSVLNTKEPQNKVPQQTSTTPSGSNLVLKSDALSASDAGNDQAPAVEKDNAGTSVGEDGTAENTTRDTMETNGTSKAFFSQTTHFGPALDEDVNTPNPELPPRALENPGYVAVVPDSSGGTAAPTSEFSVQPSRNEAGDLVLSVTYKGKSLDHLVGKNELGQLAIAESVAKDVYDGFDDIDTVTSSDVNNQNDKNIDDPTWLHPQSSTRAERERKLMVGGMEDGTFLVENRDGIPEYILCVMYRGTPMSFLIRPGPDGFLRMNDQLFGQFHRIEELIDTLRESTPSNWPTRLVRGIPRPGMPQSAGEYYSDLIKSQEQWNKYPNLPTPRRTINSTATPSIHNAQQENLRRLIYLTTPQEHFPAQPLPNRNVGHPISQGVQYPRSSGMSPQWELTGRRSGVSTPRVSSRESALSGTFSNPSMNANDGYSSTRLAAANVLASQIQLLKSQASKGHLIIVNAKAQGYSSVQLHKQISDLHRLNQQIFQLETQLRQLQIGDYWGATSA